MTKSSNTKIFIASIFIIASFTNALLPNCKTAGQNNSQGQETCQTCNDYYFLSTGATSCQPCHTSCKTCTSSTACTSCNPGKYLSTADNLCQPCPTGCLECSAQNKCTYCDMYRVLINGECAKCSPGCRLCRAIDNCDECQGGHEMYNDGGKNVCREKFIKMNSWTFILVAGSAIVCCLALVIGCIFMQRNPENRKPAHKTGLTSDEYKAQHYTYTRERPHEGYAQLSNQPATTQYASDLHKSGPAHHPIQTSSVVQSSPQWNINHKSNASPTSPLQLSLGLNKNTIISNRP